MKKLSLVLLALILPTGLFAMDLNPGTFELSGQTSLNFSDLTTETTGVPDIDTTTWTFQVDGVYYVVKNLGVGLLVQYESTEIEEAGFSTDISTLIIGPQVTYNFPLNPTLSVFVNGALGYATAEVDNVDADGFAYQVGAGLKYFLTNSVSINGSLSYVNLDLEDDFNNDVETSGVNVGIGLSIYF